MLLVVLFFGAVITILGSLGLLGPSKFIAVVSRTWLTPLGPYIAVAARLVFGLALIAAAAESRFPSAFQILGIISLIGAAAIPVLGRRRVQRWVEWWTVQSQAVIRVWSLCAAAFGAFLVYGAL